VDLSLGPRKKDFAPALSHRIHLFNIQKMRLPVFESSESFTILLFSNRLKDFFKAV
jgi:hypothetical protein